MQPRCVGAIVWCLALSWGAAATEEPAPQADDSVVEELIVEARAPRYAAATRRDRIGRVWVPVAINGRGPFRLVVDTGATSSAIVRSVAERLGVLNSAAARVARTLHRPSIATRIASERGPGVWEQQGVT